MTLNQALFKLINVIQTKQSVTTDTQWGTFVYNEEVLLMDRALELNVRIEEVIKEINQGSILNRAEIQQLLGIINTHGSGFESKSKGGSESHDNKFS